jgi:hypothetical protein
LAGASALSDGAFVLAAQPVRLRADPRRGAEQLTGTIVVVVDELVVVDVDVVVEELVVVDDVEGGTVEVVVEVVVDEVVVVG